jgi:hypothetical protein
MFGWFKDKEKIAQTEKQMLDLINEIKNTTANLQAKASLAQPRAQPTPPKEENTVPAHINDVYTIGNNINGDTIIHMKSGQTSMVLTLNADATNRMIRLLLATLDSEDQEFEEKQKQQEENE